MVMIQCVGCRNEDRNYCARICCSQAVKNSLALKELNPEMDIYVLFRDMRTYGFKEDYYREASERDVRFIRFTPEDAPRVEAVEEGGRSILRVTVNDPILATDLVIDADTLALSAAVIPPEGNRELAQLFQVALSPDDFFKEAHVKLRPVEFATDGVYLCGDGALPQASVRDDQPGVRRRGPGRHAPLPRHRRRLGLGVRGDREAVLRLRGVQVGLQLRRHPTARDPARAEGGGQSRALQGRWSVQRRLSDRGDLAQALHR